MSKAAELIGTLVVVAIGISIGIQVFLDTTPQIIESANTEAFNVTGNNEDAGGLENLSVTGKTVASFIPLLYIVLPLAFVGGTIVGLVLVGRKLLN